jgi:acyl dehydratase
MFGTTEHGRCYGFRASVLWSASANKPIGKLSKFMTAAVTSALESRVGHYYQVDGTYQVGREKVREYARAVQDKHPAHWDPVAAAELGYSGVVAPLTFTSIPGMMANRELFESVVVGYDTYVQTEEVFEQHRPIVAGDELHVDVELSSVRRIAGRDLITVTNTFTDSAGERVHTLHTTVVGVTADDVDPAIKAIVQNAMMHDAYALPIGKSESAYQKTVRPDGEIRIADGGTTRTPGTPDFDDVKVGDELSVHHARLSRGDLVNYSGVAGDANPIHWDEDIAKAAGLPDVIAHGMLTMGLGAGFASAWSGDPGAVTRYAVRLSQPAIVSAAEGADIEFSGRIKSLDPATRTGVVLVGAKSGGRKIFGLATLNVRFR